MKTDGRREPRTLDGMASPVTACSTHLFNRRRDHMPKIDLPKGAGEWNWLDSQNGAELWKRKVERPDGEVITLYVVGSEHSPEVTTVDDLTEARTAFAVAQLKSQ